MAIRKYSIVISYVLSPNDNVIYHFWLSVIEWICIDFKQNSCYHYTNKRTKTLIFQLFHAVNQSQFVVLNKIQNIFHILYTYSTINVIYVILAFKIKERNG